MKSLIVVSLVGASVLLGLPAGAQQMPPPYAPPVPPQLQQPQLQQVPDTQADGLPLPTADEVTVPARRRDPTGVRSEFAEFAELCRIRRTPSTIRPLTSVRTTRSRRATTTATTPRRTRSFRRRSRRTAGGTTTARTATSGRRARRSSAAGFSPYATGGHFALTEYGWTWVSDWNWGWAPFHYGRWITRAGRWSWVPGSMWGPAWVSWRSGGGYVGWSPLPPRGVRLAGGYGARIALAVRAGGQPGRRASDLRLVALSARDVRADDCRVERPVAHARQLVSPRQRGTDPRHHRSPRHAVAGRAERLAARRGLPAPRRVSQRAPVDAHAGGAWRCSDAGLARRHAGRAAAHRRARTRLRLEPGGPCRGPRAVGELVAAAGAGLRERRRLRPSIQQRMVRAGATPVIWRTDCLRRPEHESRASERVPRAGADARVPRPRADARVPRPRAGVPRTGAVLQPASPFVRASFERRFQPLRIVVGRRQPSRRIGRRPLRRLRRRRASPLTAVDALSLPRYQESLGRLTQRKSATFTRWKP